MNWEDDSNTRLRTGVYQVAPTPSGLMVSGRVCFGAATEDLFNGLDSRRARAACPIERWSVARRKLTQLNRVRDLRELAVAPGNRLERLTRDRHGQHSIRIDDQYRVCLRGEDIYAYEVEVTDYH
ncbi:MAG TPA: type II toxin-antitoxin system RelE/ParE family toxin [Gemmatimonadaceae bacterium]|nr:type II toxin-antitoxin system RelE/ParE family toxin [Gemmatimonadaceae bacterium]